jgi:hypothetical protein
MHTVDKKAAAKFLDGQFVYFQNLTRITIPTSIAIKALVSFYR